MGHDQRLKQTGYRPPRPLPPTDALTRLLRGDLGPAVQQLKQEPGKGLFVGGVMLPRALAELGLIDEYEIIVHPRLELGSGAVALRYEPRRSEPLTTVR